MKEQKNSRLVEVLNEKFKELKKANPKYSLRAFATRLDMNSGALSAILSGKRSVSQKGIDKIAKLLKLDAGEKAYISQKPAAAKANIKYAPLKPGNLKVLSDWRTFAILSLMKTRNFESRLEWIAARLQTTTNSVAEAVQRLIKEKILFYDEKSNLKRDPRPMAVTPDTPTEVFAAQKRDDIRMAAEALENNWDNIEFKSMVMAIDTSLIPQASELIRQFQDDMADLLETTEATEVYQLNIQLFPLTKVK